MTNPNRSLVTSREAADMLGVERRTLLRMEEAGTLTAVRHHPTAHRLYRVEQIRALLEPSA